MLLSFSVENWMSLRDRVSFSMFAGQESQHGERLPKLSKYRKKVLPIAAIYGGNASGKTNFFKALSFVKKLVVKGTQPDGLILCEPFRLDESTKNPSCFCFELLIEDDIYEYSFSVTQQAVIEEKLVHIKSASEKVLYHRHAGKPNFDMSLQENKFLEFAFQGTRDNQLLLTNSVSQKVEIFRPIYDWFRDTLVLIAPDSRFEAYEQFLDENGDLYAAMNKILPQLGMGITRLGGEEIPFENLPIPEALKTKLQEDVKEGTTVRFLTWLSNEYIAVTRRKGELLAKKLVTYHQKLDGKEIQFEMRHESDGSRRVIDLLPAFLDLSTGKSQKVYVIDELDRSLHTHLTRDLITAYLASCSAQSRSQLLMTTHDVMIMDQKLLRRDEMWVAERDKSGISNLYSFNEFKEVRYDKDIRKSYLQGRLGGIPEIFLDFAFFGNSRGISADKEK